MTVMQHGSWYIADGQSIARTDQIIQSVAADLSNAEDSRLALERAAKLHDGRAPDEIYLCAGASYPELFVDVSTETLTKASRTKSTVGGW